MKTTSSGDLAESGMSEASALTTLRELRKEISRQAEASSAWLLAALLTVNGGALLAIISAGARIYRPGLPAGLFLAGLLACLASSLVKQVIYTQVSSSARLYEDSLGKPASGNRERHGASVAGLSTKLQFLRRFENVPSWLIVASLCLCGAGAITALNRTDVYAQDERARCKALQNDMLAAVPRRKDSRELFVALQCHASGSGVVHASN